MKITSIDQYISAQPQNDQPALIKLRQIINSTAPKAEEVISYNMPAFKANGMLVGFLNCKSHTGFYPWNAATVKNFKEDLKGYATTKGSIHLPKSKSLPVTLIKKIIKARLKENSEKQKAKK